MVYQYNKKRVSRAQVMEGLAQVGFIVYMALLILLMAVFYPEIIQFFDLVATKLIYFAEWITRWRS